MTRITKAPQWQSSMARVGALSGNLRQDQSVRVEAEGLSSLFRASFLTMAFLFAEEASLVPKNAKEGSSFPGSLFPTTG